MALIPRYDARTRTPLQGVQGRAQAFPVNDTIAQAVSGVGDGLSDLARGIQTGDRLNEIKAQREAQARAKAQDENDEAWWTGQAPNAMLGITQGIQNARTQTPDDGSGYADRVLKIVDETYSPFETQAQTPKAKELVAKAKASAKERFGVSALDYENQTRQVWRGAQVDKAEQSALETVRTAPVDTLGDTVKSQVEAYGSTLGDLEPTERVKRQAAFGAKIADAAYERRVLDEAERTGRVSDGAAGDTVERIIGREGEAFVANDNGAPSKFGIRATEPGGKRNGKLVADLTRDEARKIYLDEYAAPMGLTETAIAARPAFAEVVLDAAVNHGVDKAKDMVRESGGDWRKLIALRDAEYHRLAKANPAKYGDDLAGWINRLSGLTRDATALDRQGTDMVALLATPEAKAKAIEAGTKLVEEKNNLKRGELSTAIDRGEAGLADIERARKEGWVVPGSPDDVALIKAADTAAEKAQEAGRMAERVRMAVDQGIPLDPGNSDDRKAMNADYERRAQTWAPQEIAQRSIDYARRVGMVPSFFKGQITGGLRSADPDKKLQAATLYASLKAASPAAVRDFSDQEVADANLLINYNRMGLTSKEAVEAIALSQKLTPQEIAGRDKAFAAALGPKSQLADQALLREISDDQGMKEDRGFFGGAFTPPVEMAADFKTAAALNYRRTGDVNASMNAAYDQIRRAWGPSVFNGGRTFVKNAPEVVYGLPGRSAEDNAKWIRRQLAEETSQHADAKALRLIPAPSMLTRNGRPVYFAMKAGEDGALEQVKNAQGQPVYFQPDWNSSPTKRDQDAKAKAATAAELEKARERRARMGVLPPDQSLTHTGVPAVRAGAG